jgi:autotransporter-associated beta strand protein
VIGGTGGIALTAGSQTLTGANTYTGSTAINGGKLALTGTGSIAASSGVVMSGAGILDISGTTSGATIKSLDGTSTATTSGATGVTLGTVSYLEVNPARASLGDMAFGHLTFEREQTSLFAVSSLALGGYVGEAANARFTRLCAENGISSALYAVTGSQAMGVQGRDDVLTLLHEVAETDGGMLYEPRSTADLAYRSLETLYSQVPFTVPYTDNLLLPFEPIEDDAGTRNTVTVTRDGGATATVRETSGPLGTQAIGTYDGGVTLSLGDDDAPELQASWRVHLGTHDEARWPVIGYDLADPRINTGLRSTLLGAASLGSRIDVTNLPPWLPPFPVSQIVTAYSERITPHSYRIELQCTPARPYRVPTYGDTADRWSGEGTVTAGALTATQTTFSITPAEGVGWTSVDGPYEIVIGGEVMRVTNVTGGTSFTVVRSVNGVRKTHLAGAAVALADPVYYGL